MQKDTREVLSLVCGGQSDLQALQARHAQGRWPTLEGDVLRDLDGWTPLHLAVKFQRLETAKWLINNALGGPIDDSNQGKGTPLHLACLYAGSQGSKFVELLLQNGADVSILNSQELTALNLAEKRKLFKITRMLKEATVHQEELRAANDGPRVAAAPPQTSQDREERKEVDHAPVPAAPALHATPEQPVPAAIVAARSAPFVPQEHQRQAQELQHQLARQLNSTLPTHPVLQQRVANSVILETRMHLRHVARPDEAKAAQPPDQPQVVVISESKEAELTEPTLETDSKPEKKVSFKGFNEKNDIQERLFVACTKGKIELVKDLVAKGASLLWKDKDQNQPLLLAALNGHLELCKLLIASGVPRYAINSYGWTALHCACVHGSFTLSRYFCEEVLIDPEILDSKGKPAAFYTQNRKFVQWLQVEGPRLAALRKADLSRDSCADCGELMSRYFFGDTTEAVPFCDGITPQLTQKVFPVIRLGRPPLLTERMAYDPEDPAVSPYQVLLGDFVSYMCCKCNLPGKFCRCMKEWVSVPENLTSVKPGFRLKRVHRSSSECKYALLSGLLKVSPSPIFQSLVNAPLFDPKVFNLVFALAFAARRD